MNDHGITSARYADPEPPGGYQSGAPIIATVRGVEQNRYLGDDIEGGGMLAYVAGGGMVDPYVAPVVDLAEVKAEKIALAWAEHATRFHAYEVVVAVNGADRPYRCDPVTRENIMAIVTAINANAAAVPNPRPYTPSGQLTPVDTTHAEFQAIYFAGLAAGDAHYLAYATHKAAINALTDAAGVQAYDVTTGWPT